MLPEPPAEETVATGSEVQVDKTFAADEDSALEPSLATESSSGQGDPATVESVTPGPEQVENLEAISTESTEGNEVNTD